jgi:hypothetical protein
MAHHDDAGRLAQAMGRRFFDVIGLAIELGLKKLNRDHIGCTWEGGR